MRQDTRFGMLVVLLSLACGCSAKSREAAEAGARDFRAQCARRAFADIYKAAAPDFHAATTEADFLKLMEGVNRKLGSWQSSKPRGWRVFTGLGGGMVTMGYESKFERGAATEEFRWRIREGRAILLGYQINSPAFVVN